ncbi:hypothetical protein NDU88_001546 [Pleurodeles waltl]|uniref:Uncharacterized protein n=1 Tax=Pleurodeles waltl TaxID=8319 RepID=A0AAV7SD76_PLEWA|nr:hypothetical protein NDU88_001546 [Pleurodeles waltl]
MAHSGWGPGALRRTPEAASPCTAADHQATESSARPHTTSWGPPPPETEAAIQTPLPRVPRCAAGAGGGVKIQGGTHLVSATKAAGRILSNSSPLPASSPDCIGIRRWGLEQRHSLEPRLSSQPQGTVRPQASGQAASSLPSPAILFCGLGQRSLPEPSKGPG